MAVSSPVPLWLVSALWNKWQYLEKFLLPILKWGCYLHLEASCASKYRATYRPDPLPQNYAAQSVNNAEARDPAPEQCHVWLGCSCSTIVSGSVTHEPGLGVLLPIL